LLGMHLILRAGLSNTLILLSACWARSCTLKAAPGVPRLLTALPVVAINLTVPLLFDMKGEFLTLVFYLLLLTWLANFKVMLCSVFPLLGIVDSDAGTVDRGLRLPYGRDTI
jgi:hypothetical protein